MHRRTMLAFVLLPTAVVAQTFGIVNGDFSEGLRGWTTEIRGGGSRAGRIVATTAGASFSEGASSLVSLQQVFRVEPNTPALSFDVVLLLFDRASRQAGDRLEVSLLDPTTGKSVVPTWNASSEAFVAAWEGGVGFGSGVRVLGAKALQDLRAVSGRDVRLRVDLIGGDDDNSSFLFVNNFEPRRCRDKPLLTKAPKNNEVRIAADQSREFEVEFLGEKHAITSLTVDSSNLMGFTWKKPSLGRRASIIATWSPSVSQISSKPYRVLFTATNACESTIVPIDLYAHCIKVSKSPPGNAVATAANTAKEFEVEFEAQPGDKITEVLVDSSNLRGFTWSKATLGRRGTIRARWAPTHNQISGGPYPVRFSAKSDCAPTEPVTVTVNLTAYEFGCGLMLGGSRTNVNLGNGDYLLVNPALTYLITNRMPVFAIPNDRRLAGLRIFSQVFMGNQLRTRDPLMLSNGLEIVLGDRATPYGSERFMRLRARAVPKLGQTLEFDLAIR